ncbi:MAG: TAT-variant-translocated molybdopterin oxidoreductase [Anaerolineae bacterium]
MTEPLDLEDVATKVTAKQDRKYWRTLQELADGEGFQSLLEREFPRMASVWTDGVTRRRFLQIMGASLALGGLAACSPLDMKKIVPYVKQPEGMVLGMPMYFASAMPLSGFGKGVLVASYEGRPTKIEGNIDSAASLGATDAFMQASTLVLYDPDRAQAIRNGTRIRPYEAFSTTLRSALELQKAAGGSGLRILTETVTSPTLVSQLQGILKAYPQAKWVQYEPALTSIELAGTQLAFGAALQPVYSFDKAKIIVSLDSNFMGEGPGDLAYSKAFAKGRKPDANMNRLYAATPMPTVTSAIADNRLPIRASDIEPLARIIASRVGVAGVSAPSAVPQGLRQSWVDAVVTDLQANKGASIVIAGNGQPPIVHALAAAINDALGNTGKTVAYIDPVQANPTDMLADLRDLVADMNAGKVSVLLILGGNPAYDAPIDIPFGQALANVNLSAHVSLYNDETSALCKWMIPEAHFLESWGDVRAFDGSASIIQPLIAPLYGGKSYIEILNNFSDDPTVSGYDTVRAYWKGQANAADFETWWRKAVYQGVVPDTASKPKPVTLRPNFTSGAAPSTPQPGIEIVFRLDPSVYDGRFANAGWLQELPRPIHKLTWDNAAQMSPATAQRLGINVPGLSAGPQDRPSEALTSGQTTTQTVTLTYKGNQVTAPVMIVPGHADNAVTVNLGYGRTQAGNVGNNVGFSAYALRTSDAPWFGGGLQVAVQPGSSYPLAMTQVSYALVGRDYLVRSATLEEYKKDPEFARLAHEAPAVPADVGKELESGLPSMYPPFLYDDYKWGMSIDMTVCIGCNICSLACQAENNIPVVGKEEVHRGRVMHWLLIDQYYKGEAENPETYYQPRPCMQCELAPCEPVCPVAATVHSSEGLNDMVYNRCVGTRYCSNNCPYKVRRFNYLQHTNYWPTSEIPQLKLLMNPQVTVRTRGVMEKCTYCVQRIKAARIEAEKAGRKIRDGDVLTACQAACPTNAIVFGDLNDPNSQVSKLKEQPTDYALLAELNTRPRTTFLAAIRNPSLQDKNA